MNPVIWIDGIIGAGKTTLTRTVAQILGMRAIFEPVDDNPLLGRFYEDQARYAFSMQMLLMWKRYGLQQLAVAEAAHGDAYKGAIIDRGLPGDRVFARMHVRNGNIDGELWPVYEGFYRQMMLGLPTPTMFVFLDVRPEVAFERVRRRARSAEGGLPIDYLRDLRSEYLMLISEIQSGDHAWSRGMVVHVVDWNEDHQDPRVVTDIIETETRMNHGPIGRLE